jgi:GMP synthase-like glutamine amidotransferase
MDNINTQILIIDLGSQYTEIIRRSLRYLGFRSEIISPEEIPGVGHLGSI